MKQQLEKIQALLLRGVYAAAEHELEQLIADCEMHDGIYRVYAKTVPQDQPSELVSKLSAPYPHPRISEQDAVEIGLSAIRYCNDNPNWYVDNWLEDSGLTLLAKLNQDQSTYLNDWTRDLAL